jgi:hypothetical protein
MENEQPDVPVHLFTLRLWQVALEEGKSEWRGRIFYTATGEVRHFRDLASLIPLLLAMSRDENA